ncbi:pyridoxal phosphate-dependent aminotransferase [Pelagibacterium halotolerans]|uniref:aspartate transaminase n=1 Tax=Pelagibacterium halotolerans (strain DSM 22347 / JCM 15775 / CGMCC 1.7692 / B2) TaxID=1082931 RepID=G4REC8_PELHB|nr:pyridoxal phosphate-dependent aminotransferase [Pelagibacterium halotolerans]AEQ52873.1 aspartate aminotransferase [Pelagibacterium halotolerans B2]QJR17450.1 pyridoxal phosphate-dependent aminotransferase [Pelagibacterium halotolerans]SEA74403.1 Aspartate/methionine/tyrosine aminotransferase [Pelagibacterium halotolerans]
MSATARPQVSALSSSRIRDIANAGMGRADIAAFWFGEGDEVTPAFIREAAQKALADGETFYVHNLGLPQLREAVASYENKLQGINSSPERIAITGSGVSALMIANQLIVSPGDKVVVITPIWPNITEAPRLLGANIVRFPLNVTDGKWSLDLDRLLATLTADTRMVIVNAPNNPTGFTLDQETQKTILEHCRRHGIWVLSDEVYERLIFDGNDAAPSMLRHAEPEDRIIRVNSFSKSWRMTGWRLGWLTLPLALMPDVPKVIEYNTSCAPSFVQKGGLAALTDPRGEETVAALRSGLRASRSALLDGLTRMDRIEIPDAQGAMYAFFRITGEPDDMATAKALVADHGLGLAPGSAFGPEGAGWLRWCFAAKPEKIAIGLERLERFLGR